jgi:hypothetical protein
VAQFGPEYAKANKSKAGKFEGVFVRVTTKLIKQTTKTKFLRIPDQTVPPIPIQSRPPIPEQSVPLIPVQTVPFFY